MPPTSSRLAMLSLFVLLAFLPLGVAGQNMGSGLAAILLFTLLYQKRADLPTARLWHDHKIALSSVAAFLGMQIVSTFLNPKSPIPYSVEYLYGHLHWALVPPLTYLVIPKLSARDWQRLFVAFTIVACVLGVVALSQTIWGWRIAESQVEWGFPRAQGLYSHPISLAYGCLVLLPFTTMAVCRWPRAWLPWLSFLGILAALFASESRTVQVVSAGVIGWNIWRLTRGRVRLICLGAAVLAGVLILTTHNPVGERFRGTLVRHDVRSDYADDRLAFWHANFNMFKERPLVGHGEGLNLAYRAPYYAAIGLDGFIRRYEAHNMYLQVAVNEGLVGLVIFLVWLGDLLLFARRGASASDSGRAFAGAAAVQTVVAFGLAAVTQNAFQDSAVRYTLTVMIAALWLYQRDLASPAP